MFVFVCFLGPCVLNTMIILSISPPQCHPFHFHLGTAYLSNTQSHTHTQTHKHKGTSAKGLYTYIYTHITYITGQWSTQVWECQCKETTQCTEAHQNEAALGRSSHLSSSEWAQTQLWCHHSGRSRWWTLAPCQWDCQFPSCRQTSAHYYQDLAWHKRNTHQVVQLTGGVKPEYILATLFRPLSVQIIHGINWSPTSLHVRGMYLVLNGINCTKMILVNRKIYVTCWLW